MVNNKMLLAYILGLVLMLVAGKVLAGLFQKKSEKSIPQDSTPFPELTFLEGAPATNHEILRLSGYPAGNVRYIPSNNTYIIPTSLRFKAWVNLWRINANGVVVDSFSPDGEYEGNLPAAGIFFRKENYIDWAFTGDKLPKPYVKTLNAKSLGKEKTAVVLAQAKQIVWTKETYYEQIYRGSKETYEFQYFLKGDDGWSILLSPDELTSADFPPLKYALKDDFVEEYRGPDLGVKILNTKPFDVKTSESPIQLLSFKKLGSSKSGFGDFNSSAWVGDYGFGHFQFHADNEVIDFKSFHRILINGVVGNQDEPDMNFYDLKGTSPDNHFQLLILLTGRAPARDDLELGSYIIRNKLPSAITLDLNPQQRNYVESTQKRHLLGVSIKGLEAVQSNLYWMTYFNGLSESFRQPNSWTIPADSRSIPMEVRGSFELPENPKTKLADTSDATKISASKNKKSKSEKPNNKYYSYALKINEQYFTWSDVDNISYALHFDHTELEKALRDFSSTTEPVDIAIHFNVVPGGVELSVLLSNATKSYQLRNVRFASVGSQEARKEEQLFIFDQKLIAARNLIASQHKPYGLEGPPPEKIPASLALIRKIVEESEYPDKLSSSIVDASWFILNGAISANNDQLKLDAVNNYVVHLFPKMSGEAPSIDFISRAVDLGVSARNDELLNNINRAFFSPETKVDYDKYQWLLEDKTLKESFKTAMFNSAYTDNYIWLSSKVFPNNMNIERLSPEIANHYTKLLLKSLNEKNYELATRLSNSFIDAIYPTIGYSEKSTDVISGIIVTGLITKNEKLLQKVVSNYVNNPDYDKGKNQILYYNIACYYASRGEKTNMLSAIKSSLEYGHDTETFITDRDFALFRNDPDFIDVLESSKGGK